MLRGRCEALVVAGELWDGALRVHGRRSEEDVAGLIPSWALTWCSLEALNQMTASSFLLHRLSRRLQFGSLINGFPPLL
jgi:hypothetical protein